MQRLADYRSLPGRHDYINGLDLGDLVEALSAVRCPSPALLHIWPKRLPQHVGQEADQDVGLDPLFLLMPDRSDPQVALLDAEGGFRLGQLDVRLPEFLGAPVGDVAPQQVAALAQSRPRLATPPPSPRPRQPRRPIAVRNVDLEQAGGTAVVPQQSAHSPFHRPQLLLPLAGSSRPASPALSRSASRTARASPSLWRLASALRHRMKVSSPSGDGHSFTSSPSRTSLPVLPCSSSLLEPLQLALGRAHDVAPSLAAGTPGSPPRPSPGPSPRCDRQPRTGPPSSPRSPPPWSHPPGCRQRPRSPAASPLRSPPGRCTPACSPDGGRASSRAGPARWRRTAPSK